MRIYLKGRNPPMAMWIGRLRYQGAAGISRAMFLVLHGASKPLAMFLPSIPPRTVRGKPTARNRISSALSNVFTKHNKALLLIKP